MPRSVCPSVCLSVCPSMIYRNAGCVEQLPRLYVRWLPAAGRPPEMCGLRTRPRTDVDPPRVELPSGDNSLVRVRIWGYGN